jgi:hypothetical protein
MEGGINMNTRSTVRSLTCVLVVSGWAILSADQLCPGGSVIWNGSGSMVGCRFPNSAAMTNALSVCKGAKILPNPTPPGTCFVCASDPSATQIPLSNWTGLTIGAPRASAVPATFPDCVPPPCIKPPSNMTNWYKFDASNPLRDSSASGNNLNGTAATVPGEVLEGQNFTGTSTSALTASIKTQPDFGERDFSFDSWIFIPNGATNSSVQVLVEKRQQTPLQGWSFYLYKGRMGIQIAAGGNSWNFGPPAGAPTIPQNQWVLVAATVARSGSPARVTFYINGAPAGAAAIASPAKIALVSNSTPMKIGERTISNDGFLNAQLDELELFNRALSSMEVLSIFKAGPGGKCHN